MLSDEQKLHICNQIIKDNMYAIRIRLNKEEEYYISDVLSDIDYIDYKNTLDKEKIKVGKRIRLKKIKLIKNYT